MKEKTLHTPGPWTTDGSDIYAHGLIVAQVSFRLEQCEANAQFIVRAVNSHTQLLEALEKAPLPSITGETFAALGNPTTFMDSYLKWFDSARAAIELARQG